MTIQAKNSHIEQAHWSSLQNPTIILMELQKHANDARAYCSQMIQ